MEQLWVDKYRPKRLDHLTFHPEITQVLDQIASTNDFPHIILYGPDGAGKKTRAYAFLERVFGSHVFKLKEEEKILKPESTSTTIQYSLFTSNYHIEITPSDHQHNDRHIIQNVVKEIASNSNVETKNSKSFKLLLINQADKLSKDAQGGLRRTMEKYMKNCRMILLCNSIHKLIPPLRSRCLNIRVPAPTKDAIMLALSDISKQENLKANSTQIYQSIADNCDRNLRSAILQLQASRHSKNHQAMLSPYKKEIKDICILLFKEQTPVQLKKIRDKFYDLLVNCVEGAVVLKELVEVILKTDGLRQQTQKEIINLGADHERTLACGSKAIYHLESFAAHVMEQIIINANSMIKQ